VLHPSSDLQSTVLFQVSGVGPLVTGFWPEARSEKPAAKRLTPETRQATGAKDRHLNTDPETL